MYRCLDHNTYVVTQEQQLGCDVTAGAKRPKSSEGWQHLETVQFTARVQCGDAAAESGSAPPPRPDSSKVQSEDKDWASMR